MTLAEVIGCALITFTAPVALFLYLIAADPLRVFVAFGAAFSWLLALLAAGLLWLLTHHFGTHVSAAAFVSVLFQEAFRGLLFLGLRWAKPILLDVAQESHTFNRPHLLAVVAGYGFGIMAAAFAISNFLRDLSGYGSVGLTGCPVYLPLLVSAYALGVFLLHIAWTVIAFHGYHSCRLYLPVIVTLGHAACTALSLLNEEAELLFIVTVSGMCGLVVLSGLLALVLAGADLRWRTIRKDFLEVFRFSSLCFPPDTRTASSAEQRRTREDISVESLSK